MKQAAHLHGRPKLRLIRGGRGQKPKTISGKALLRSLRNLSHDEAVGFVIRQAGEHIHQSGVYRVGRLYFPGYITITYVPQRAGGRYLLEVRDERGVVVRSFPGLEISHAVLDLLAIWEEEPDESPRIVS